jgi:hypothetical protein
MGDSSVPTGQASAITVPLFALEGQTHKVAAEALAPVLIEFFTTR